MCAPRKTVAYSETPTNLKQHLKNKYPVEFADVVRSGEQKKNPKQSSIKDLLTVLRACLVLQYPKGKSCELSKKIAEMIALEMLPYSIVQGLGFRRLIDYLAPGYKIPSRVYFSRTGVPKLYQDVMSKITPQLSSAISAGTQLTFGRQSPPSLTSL